MTPEKQDKTLELSKHWSADSTPARNEVIMKRTYPVKSVKCDKICSNYTVFSRDVKQKLKTRMPPYWCTIQSNHGVRSCMSW